jgi:thiol-disulfide isomerase/thioredoxin
MAPDFQLQALDGQEYSLSGLRGRPILLNIWASWCPPCRSEMPAMQQLHQDYFEQGFIILAVNATNQDDLTAAKDFISSRGLSFPILLDTEGNVSSLYQVRSLPTSFFIDTSGRIHEIIIGGPMAEALMRVRAEHLLLGVRP